jgi:uncharacterized protein (TIGR04255 family)
VQFEPLTELHAGLLGALWEEYRDRYPRVEQNPPLPLLREEFDVKPARFGFNVGTFFPMPRVWFLNHEGTRLVQVQRDFFAVNWRKLETEDVYPRYPTLRQALIEELGRFQAYVEREGLPPIRPVQAELTYVNHINAREADGSRTPLSRIIRIWTGDQLAELPKFEEAAFQAHYIFADAGTPIGRLHVNLDPQLYVKNNAPLYALTLVARGMPEAANVEAALAFLDRGHEAIVRAFTAITTDEMHRLWERQR